jgi:hypothetical protein
MKTLVLVLAPLVVLFTSCEEEGHKIDREVGWREVKSYPTTAHGIEIGSITVPGHTQRVTFYSWGIPKDTYLDENEEPRIIGEMNRDVTVNDPDDLSDLGRIALAAYNHGGVRVILTKHKAYLVTSDIEELDEADARAGQ